MGDPATKPEGVDRSESVEAKADIEQVCPIGTLEVEELLGAEAATVLSIDWSSSIFVAVVEIMYTTCR